MTFTEEERQLILEAALDPDRAAAEERMAEAFGTDGEPRGTRYLLAAAAADQVVAEHARRLEVAAATELAHQVTRARASRASVASRPDAARPAAPPAAPSGRLVRMLEKGASPAGELTPIMREQRLRRRYAHDPDGLIRAWVAGET
jgi:hypothetical protein